jgi:hypothetical protein
MRRQTFLAAVSGGCFALAAFWPASSATAAPEGTLESISLELATGIFAGVTVVSSNGTSWTGLKHTDVSLGGSLKVDMKTGRVKAAGIYLGACGGHQCFEGIATPLLGSAHFGSGTKNLYGNTVYPPKVEGAISLSFPAHRLGVSTTGIAVPAFGDAIIDRCNAGLNEGQSIHKGFGFTHTVQMTLGADTRTVQAIVFDWPGGPDAIIELGSEPLTDVDFSKTINVQIPVICEAVPLPKPTSDIQHDFGDFDVKNVKLFLTTVQPGEPGSNPGTVCPRLKVTSRAQTNQAGPVTMRIWRKKNSGPITAEVKQTWAAYDAAKNGYFATYEKWEHAGTTSTFQFKTEIVENDPFPPFDGWKDITVNCTGAGGGGIASNTSSSNPDDNGAPPPLQIKGDFSFLADNGTSCPRKAKALINFTSSVKDSVHYSLDCTNGHFSGVAKTAPKSGGGYVAPALVTFDVTGTTQVNCALKSVAPGKPKVHTLKGHLFQCVKTTGVAGSKDVQIEPKPKAIAPQRKIACAGGRVRHGKCVCKRGFNAVAAGAKTFRCVRTAVSPTIKRAAPRIACVGGVVRSGRCYCPAGATMRNGTCVSARALQHNRIAPPRGERLNDTTSRVR